MHEGVALTTYALLDSGATGSAISSLLVQRLNMNVRQETMTVATYNYKGTALRQLVDFAIEPIDRSFSIDMRNTLVGEILTTESEQPPSQEDIENNPLFEGVVSFYELDDAHVGIVISARHAWTWETGERLTSGPNKPIAVNTAFGWALIGPCNSHDSDEVALNFCDVQKKVDTIDNNLDRLLRFDFIAREGERASPEMTHPSQNDLHALKQMEEGVRFDKEKGHYYCGLPWVRDRCSAAQILNNLDSEANAANRLRKAAIRFRQDPDRKAGVFKQMNEFIREGHARRVVDREVPDGLPVYYLPLHVVTRPDKPGKFRLCQDAASKVAGTCLNDLLLSGPDLVNRLVGVLLRFRRHPVVLSSDIKGFFHQIFVSEEDVGAFRFFWWENEDMNRMLPYEMLVHIFGAKSSPAVATFVLRHHAQLVAKDYPPEVLYAILYAFYVDDLLASYPTVEKARQMRIHLQEALQRGGFELCKWKSTHGGVLDSKDEAEGVKPLEAKAVDGLQDTVANDKVLGVSYSFATDNFSVRIGEKAKHKAYTRRQMLALVASIFDPLGLVAPALLKGKILLQRATAAGYGWDEPVSEEIAQEFEAWRSNLGALTKHQVPRWLASPATTNGPAELHLFSDASVEAYGIAAYTRFANSDNTEFTVRLVFSRAHVVPLDMAKRVVKDQENHLGSIPRLELTAARLAAVVRETIRHESDVTFSRIIMWTDSTCVIKWVRDMKTRFTTFIRNRLVKILELTNMKDWRYVATQDNPADDCSRGLEPTDAKWDRFLNGPAFLWQPEAKWPVQDPKLGIEKPASPVCLSMLTTAPGRPSFEWAVRIAVPVSGWVSKIRRVAIFVNFIRLWRRCRKAKFQLSHVMPTVADVRDAETRLVAGIQQSCFSKEIESLSGDRPNLSPKNPSLTILNPFVDGQGLLRAGGRLGNATNLSYDAKYPLIMPGKGDMTDSLIRHEHERNGHTGVNHTFSQLQQRFWILKGREAVRHLINRCVTCQKALKAPTPQMMAELPAERVDGQAPFEATGIDICGPFAVRNGGRGFHKRWILLLTCLACRAVHFEVLRDMKSGTFLNALIRFHARRPGLRILVSDNGTTFKGGNNELKRAIKEWNEANASALLLRGIEWRFGPPHAPHWGGVWERLVRELKKHLHFMLTKDKHDLDVFTTALVEVERIMNGRPLTYVSSDIKDMTPLCPANFLYPGVVRHSSVNIFPPRPPGADNLRYSWKKTRALVESFWARWTTDYLHTLQRRTKWKGQKPNLYVGQLVLVCDEQIVRDKWPLGRIDSVKGDGNHIRSAIVTLATGKQFERHCTKLVPLELD